MDAHHHNNAASKQRSLNEERNELKKQLNYSASQQSFLTKDRYELEIQLNDSDLCKRKTVKKGFGRAATVILGLLCLLLLGAVIAVVFFALQQSPLTKERDELKKQLEEFKHYSQHGWVYFSGSFYFISSNKNTWQHSRDDCRQKGADLMIINSKEEQEFSRSFKKVLWIGLTDRHTEGLWKWVDGTPLTTSYWSSGEPNNHKRKAEDCGLIWWYDSEDSWNDSECENENLWICEKNTVS